MTYETVAELLADVQTNSLKSRWSRLVWRPNQFADLSADSSLASICCCWTLIRRIASTCSVPVAFPSTLGEIRCCEKGPGW